VEVEAADTVRPFRYRLHDTTAMTSARSSILRRTSSRVTWSRCLTVVEALVTARVEA
jgi:hypothetical protein